MEYSSDKVMTRKEYLKSKKKGKFGIKILKYSLLLTTIVLLSIYLFKQLDIYNNVTKMANKVIEETALARTLKMYYIADGYTKDSVSEVVVYKAYDESRSKIAGTEGFSNICIANGKLYGILEEQLYSIDLETNEKIKIIEQSIKEYSLNDEKIYCYVETKSTKEIGIYVYEGENKELKLLINAAVHQFLVDDNYVYVIAKGKTEKSIIRYNLNGSGRTVLTNKEIVTYMSQDKDYIYYIVNEQLYRIKKNAKTSSLLVEDKIYIDSDIKNSISSIGAFAVKDDMVYYITKGEEKTLCAYNMKTKSKQVISKKNVESIQLRDNMLYYKVDDGIGIYKINLESGKSEHVTNIRGIEYICIN